MTFYANQEMLRTIEYERSRETATRRMAKEAQACFRCGARGRLEWPIRPSAEKDDLASTVRVVTDQRLELIESRLARHPEDGTNRGEHSRGLSQCSSKRRVSESCL